MTIQFDKLKETLAKRLLLQSRIEGAFKSLSISDKHLKRGPLQTQLIGLLSLTNTGYTRRLINQTMLSLGYKSVFIHGYAHYSLQGAKHGS